MRQNNRQSQDVVDSDSSVGRVDSPFVEIVAESPPNWILRLMLDPVSCHTCHIAWLYLVKASTFIHPALPVLSWQARSLNSRLLTWQDELVPQFSLNGLFFYNVSFLQLLAMFSNFRKLFTALKPREQ